MKKIVIAFFAFAFLAGASSVSAQSASAVGGADSRKPSGNRSAFETSRKAPCNTVACKRSIQPAPRVGGGTGGTHVIGQPEYAPIFVNAPVRKYGDGTLVRNAESKKVYVVAKSKLRPIRTIGQLAAYKGKPITNVEPADLNAYQVDNSTRYAEGTLVRDSSNWNVYLVKGDSLQKVRTVSELKKHAGKKIINLPSAVIAAY